MSNEDKSLVLVFNGEIYNYRAMKEELVAVGHVFATASDSEVLLHGYEEYGLGILGKLRGMFAFVIYDKNRCELFGARDFFGIKPLYHTTVDGVFLFGSEIKSFLHFPGFIRKVNERALENYLSFQYSPGPETFFSGVYKLSPGHFFRYSATRGFEAQRYWMPSFDPDEGEGIEYWADAIERVFDDSVRAHKVSDVEVGSFLSSGVDSSYIACSAHVDKTFTVGFDNGPAYNETDYARELSRMIHVKNIGKLISTEEFWNVFPKVQYHMDEPLADPSAVALYFVCNEAAKHLKTVLSGEGADEVFGGYNIYREPLEWAWYDKIPSGVRRAIAAAASMLPARRGLNFLVRRGRRLESRFIGNAYMFTEGERKALLKNPVDAPSPSDMVAPYYNMMEGKDPVTKMQFVDLNTWLAGDILLKADKMSMANSLELRVPFLDKDVMALAGRIPARFRVNKENTKYALRMAASRRMPPKWSSKRKLGFPVPIRLWLAEEKYYGKVKEAFLSNTAEQFFHTGRLASLLDGHRNGKADNSRKIWTVYSFLVWHNEYFGDGPGNAKRMAMRESRV
jgi:asparagine synthase (glutamine-hydrolysing)